jgi:hypothetical protein
MASTNPQISVKDCTQEHAILASIRAQEGNSECQFLKQPHLKEAHFQPTSNA